mmetsp:Transcript_54045/g.167731  ORF Transcript_54045/g.167731 Transcript_54045/m.167731 type:complete len:699 (-) Transcript_54045:321-2417(-)
MSDLTQFLLHDAKVDASIVSYVTKTLQLQTPSEFANYWTSAEYEEAVQTDVVQQVAAFKDASATVARLQTARLRSAWKLAQGAAPASPTPAQAPAVAAEDTAQLKSNVKPSAAQVDFATPLTLVIFGATGDLARKKLYPAAYQLMFGAPDAPLLPTTTNVVGYGRSAVDLQKFLGKQCVNVKGERKAEFLSRCHFFAGAYDKEESYAELDKFLKEMEGSGKANRIFFFSVPPTIFGDVCRCVKATCTAPGGGFTRLIIEKPFGRDSASFAQLNDITSSKFSEDSIFRIDHYLGKEVVLNLTTIRFGNQLFEAVWNRRHIASVQIVFKEDLGTGGRGGYFDKFGIVRDIMQNHLLQILLWIAMEPPEKLTREHVAEEKVKLLKAVRELSMKDCFIGQFAGNTWNFNGQLHEEPGYLDDKTVPPGSKCPTYAAVVLNIDNERWRGVPFLMRAGKGLDERMAEVRITFKEQPFNKLVPGGANELVMRIQPEEAIYLKYMNKMPGWHHDLSVPVVLDMSYATAFQDQYVADAYERMFLNTFKGDGSLFVGSSELVEAWRVFTPLLQEIDAKQPDPVIYPFGSRVPRGMDEFAQRYGVRMAENWEEYLSRKAHKLTGLQELFDSLDKDGSGQIEGKELKAFARAFFDGREPSDQQVAKIVGRLDLDGDGKLSFKEVSMGVEAIAHALAPVDWVDHAEDHVDHA